MAIALWLFAGLVTILFAYNMRFTQATLSFGQELAGSSAGTGFQDAITPPWQTNLAMLSYVGIAAAIGAIWWQLGWVSALGALALILIGGGIVGAILPGKDSPHFRRLIVQSMVSRSADYSRNNDPIRAQLMNDLLKKTGIDPITSSRPESSGSENMLRALIDNSPNGIIRLRHTTDADKQPPRCIFANKAAGLLLGTNDNELQGCHIHDILGMAASGMTPSEVNQLERQTQRGLRAKENFDVVLQQSTNGSGRQLRVFFEYLGEDIAITLVDITNSHSI